MAASFIRRPRGRVGVGVSPPLDETFDIGSKTGTPLDDRDYQVLFTFTGKLNKLTISVEPPNLTAEDEKKLLEASRAAQDAKRSVRA
jgi:arylsulfatase